MKKSYEAPTIADLGSLEQMTQQLFNKVGHANDVYTALTSGQVVGSLTAPGP